MPASLAGFILTFPEFSARPADQVGKHLAFAAENTSDTFTGLRKEEVIYLRAAVSLTSGTKGRNAKKDGGTTDYQKRLDDIEAMHAVGRRVW